MEKGPLLISLLSGRFDTKQLSVLPAQQATTSLTRAKCLSGVTKLRGVRAYAKSQKAREATDALFSGFMMKQGGKGMQRGAKWQKRWSVQTPPHA